MNVSRRAMCSGSIRQFSDIRSLAEPVSPDIRVSVTRNLDGWRSSSSSGLSRPGRNLGIIRAPFMA